MGCFGLEALVTFTRDGKPQADQTCACVPYPISKSFLVLLARGTTGAVHLQPKPPTASLCSFDGYV